MGIPSKTVRTLCGLLALLAFSNCATTQESVQDCRKAAFSFCDKAMAAKEPAGADAGARRAAYQQCLEPQLGACGVQ